MLSTDGRTNVTTVHRWMTVMTLRRQAVHHETWPQWCLYTTVHSRSTKPILLATENDNKQAHTENTTTQSVHRETSLDPFLNCKQPKQDWTRSVRKYTNSNIVITKKPIRRPNLRTFWPYTVSWPLISLGNSPSLPLIPFLPSPLLHHFLSR